MENALSPAYNRNVYTTTPSPQRNSVSPNIPHHLLQMTTAISPPYNNQQSTQNTFSSTAYTPFNQTTYPLGIATTSQHPSFTNNFEMPPISTKQTQLPSMSTMNVSSMSYGTVPSTSSSMTTQQPMHSNIPATTTESNSSANLSGLFNLDDQQFTQINSTELTGLSLSLLDETYTQAAVANQIDATSTVAAVSRDNTIDDENNMEYDNMTDSFIKRCVIKELNNLI